MASRSKGRPWKSWPVGKPVPTRTLTNWRHAAEKRAQEAGYLTSCGLCKRPLKRYGRLLLVPGEGVATIKPKALRRKVCKSCVAIVRAFILLQEQTMALDHLPELE